MFVGFHFFFSSVGSTCVGIWGDSSAFMHRAEWPLLVLVTFTYSARNAGNVSFVSCLWSAILRDTTLSINRSPCMTGPCINVWMNLWVKAKLHGANFWTGRLATICKIRVMGSWPDAVIKKMTGADENRPDWQKSVAVLQIFLIRSIIFLPGTTAIDWLKNTDFREIRFLILKTKWFELIF